MYHLLRVRGSTVLVAASRDALTFSHCCRGDASFSYIAPLLLLIPRSVSSSPHRHRVAAASVRTLECSLASAVTRKRAVQRTSGGWRADGGLRDVWDGETAGVIAFIYTSASRRRLLQWLWLILVSVLLPWLILPSTATALCTCAAAA